MKNKLGTSKMISRYIGATSHALKHGRFLHTGSIAWERKEMNELSNLAHAMSGNCAVKSN